MDFREKVIGLLRKETKLKEVPLEVPPSSEMGDYAFPCFVLAKELRKSPDEIAKELAARIKPTKIVKEIRATGPYLNFFIDKESLAEDVVRKIIKEKGKFGRGDEKARIMVEYETPNTNKPLHLGHLRNASIGMSISNILEFMGNKVIRADLFNDRGVHICQAMLAYEKLMKAKEPDKKSDHFVGDAYVLFHQKAKENPGLNEEVQKMLLDFENGDKKVLALWKKIDSWAVNGIKETDRLFGNKFDVYFRETEFYKKAKPIIEDGLKKGVFEKDGEGNIIAVLEPELPNKVVQRKDGTSIYITNDIALVPHKFEKYRINKSLWVVGNEQNLYFQQLFRIFEKLGYKWVKDCRHLSYGMVFLPEGRMKSREGTVIDADEFISEMKQLAIKELEKRHKLDKKETENRALAIALAAIKYFFLKIDLSKDMVFNPAESLSFEGETGPYVQYTHARICSILRKHGKEVSQKADLSLLKEKHELEIIRMLASFPEAVEAAARQYTPHVIVHNITALSRAFNTFYHELPVLKAEQKTRDARLMLISAVMQVLKSGLSLLGIEAPERM